MDLGSSNDDQSAEVERLRLEWLELVGTSKVVQRASHSEVAAWTAWTRWQAAKSAHESRVQRSV